MHKRTTLKNLYPYLKADRFKLFASVICSVLSVLLSLTVPVLFGFAIDALIGKDAVNFETLAWNLVYASACALLVCGLDWTKDVLNAKIVAGVSKRLRDECVEQMQSLPLSYLDKHPVGETVGRVIGDVEQVADGLLMGFAHLITGVLTVVGTLVILFVLNWIIALAVLVLTPISLLISRFISTKTYTMFKKQSEIRAEQTALLDEMIGNVQTVQAYGYEDCAIERFYAVNEKMKEVSFRATFFSSLTNPLTRFVNSLVYAGVAGVGALLCLGLIPLSSGLTVGMLSVVLNYANQYTKPFNEVTSVLAELQNAFACLGRIFEFLTEQKEEEDSDCLQLENPLRGELLASHVDFSYDPSRPLIQNFNLAVRQGQTVAIVGPTGCGKTTLINLLMRFYDVLNGEIKVDGKNVQAYSRHTLRKNYGMVLQDTWIMNGTVAENVALGNPQASREEIERACVLSHAHGFICRLPNGYDTVISDSGNLSAGERQLLCIARVMLLKPPMLILDEATSSIDTRTEAKISEAFHLLMEGKTAFIVAHRLSTIQSADVILVMKDGNVIEQGNHADLLKKGGFYSHLFNSQFDRLEQ
ncbi:MAG: ABC transporter ATP-binding protein [Clostridia bacterium]|nr:ABC transporter ATP-binding protein [Clostridia bacterium]